MIDIEELKQTLANMQAAERQLDWDRADLIAYAMDELVTAGMGRSEAANLIGSAAGNSRSWAVIQEKLAKTFAPESRFPTMSFFMYRIAYVSDDPVKAIEAAADFQMSPKELRAWIIANGRRINGRVTHIVVDGTLNWEGHEMTITPEWYYEVDVGEGLKDVPVRADIATKIPIVVDDDGD